MTTHFAKPEAGSWTQHWPELGTAPVDYTDSIDPEFYKAEQEAIFKKMWLNLGRVERLPKKGSYFTKEIAAAGEGTSVIVVNTGDGVIKAFHNVCRHRGNKLIWNDYPHEEVSGSCRQFTCKYHAWRYSLDGDLTFIQQEHEFFDIDKSDFGLIPVRCELWRGFIFINFDKDAAPLDEFLGRLPKTIEDYPFEEMTEVWSYRSEIGANWKLFIDSFAEFYHAPILHAKQSVQEESEKLIKYGFEALHYDIDTPHSLITSWGGMSPPKDLNMVKPIERILRAGLFGPWDKPDIEGIDPPPVGVNPSQHKQWGCSSFEFFPNMTLLIWEPGWYLTYHYWPTAVNKHIFECNLYLVPAKTCTERLRHEMTGLAFKEYALQDANTLEATQTMIGTKAVTEFPLCDQEILLRHLHKAVGDIVKGHRNGSK
ncbi:aromatic ring-hydroxylating dioxygenase subunit alpha [Mycobacterium sp. 1245805.9]|uniref:aromatic ring-hydroxylating oxygenase subunit alpha n=1 Tax=Mycobacterium sp. 1245805.9 TaxID=1856862 RepID=UPI0007FBE4A7|nr:aromatic ring-hydroxylating dioxygenase subunit alpha [Mycobacterium sp. 1245805.9]OBI80338.1 (2Fe-2S)-binding protein [Mycobacterium sp. 1245805.9]